MPACSKPIRFSAFASVLMLFVPLSLLAGPRSAPTVKFVLEEGAKVSDTTTITVKAKTPDDSGIEKVEFYIDNQLKFTDSSTPYEFDWDTLGDTEGAHALKAVAFDAKGNTASAKLSVTVDNELGKGAEAHAETALAALKEGNVDSAAKFARRALKVDPTNLTAARAYSGVLRQRGQLAEAVTVLDKAKIPDNDTVVRLDLIALHMAKGDAADSTEEFLKDAAAAVDIYKQVQNVRLAGAAGDPVAKGDILFGSRNWVGAIQSYQKCGAPEDAPVACVNRLILADIMANRSRDAELTSRTVVRAKHADVNTLALIGLMALNNHDFKKAREVVQDGVENRNVPSLIVAGYADLAMKQVKRSREEAEQAVAVSPDSADVQLLRAYLLADAQDARKAFVRSLELNPMLAEAYVQRGYQILLSRDAKRFDAADQMLDVASKLDPTSNYALMGKALSFIAQRRPNEAEPLLNMVLDQDKNAADVHVATALNLSLLDKTLKITEHLNIALKLDPDRWADVFVPKPMDLIARDYRYRFSPVIFPASFTKCARRPLFQ